MKKIILTLCISLISFLIHAQAHLGLTLAEIKERHPDKEFQIDYTSDGQKYAYADMLYGTFYYYFNKSTGISEYCIQIPHNMPALNAQVEIYNKKYVIISETAWKAYLEGGGLMNIKLVYDKEYDVYTFHYQD